jgi:glycogen debranching enzyme
LISGPWMMRAPGDGDPAHRAPVGRGARTQAARAPSVPDRWASVLAVVRERLLTPLGLRTLDPRHPDYKPTYHGDLRARDAAYHQGTVWPWLIGPFVEAWLRNRPEDRRGARRFVEAFVAHLDEACVGSISEIFDAEPPYTPRGCIAQGWSVAEVLRAFILTAEPGASETPAPPEKGRS